METNGMNTLKGWNEIIFQGVFLNIVYEENRIFKDWKKGGLTEEDIMGGGSDHWA